MLTIAMAGCIMFMGRLHVAMNSSSVVMEGIFLRFWQKHPLRLKDEPIRFWWSTFRVKKMFMAITQLFIHLLRQNFTRMSNKDKMMK